MKIRLTENTVVHGMPLQAGERAIVDDADGASLIARGAAIALPEATPGGFAVPMKAEHPTQTDEPKQTDETTNAEQV
jgi:hypothetical protein